MAYKGKYQLKNTHKYIGNPMNVIYHSLWERKFMVYADNSDNILEWGSEEHIIPYVSPWDGRRHRYFPDFYIKAKQHDGSIKKVIIEIKPKVQCSPPEKKPSRKTKAWYNKVKTWGINQAKWKYANEYCLDRNWEFKILTEDHLGIRYK